MNKQITLSPSQYSDLEIMTQNMLNGGNETAEKIRTFIENATGESIPYFQPVEVLVDYKLTTP